MEKVLILSYFYSPSNFVGGARVDSWSKHLSKSNYFPIVITRNWNNNQTNLTDEITNNDLSIEKSDSGEVHRLPFKRSLRDKLADKKYGTVFQKALTLYEMIFSRYFLSALPYYNFFTYTSQYLKENPDVKKIVISARPFNLFFIGYKLKKKFPNVKWIADYRDDWTTGMTFQPEGFINKLIHRLDKPLEKKWASNCEFIISASDAVADGISKFVQKPGKVVLNGFENDGIEKKSAPEKGRFRIFYSGTLYSNQNIEMLIQAVHEMNEEIEVCFMGADVMPDQWEKLNALKNKFPFISLLPRQSSEVLLKEMKKSDVFFATNYTGMNGFIPVKCYDYLNWSTPVLLCPSDEDCIKDFLIKTNSGAAASSTEECKEILQKWFADKIEKGQVTYKRNTEESSKYTREYQTQILAELLSTL